MSTLYVVQLIIVNSWYVTSGIGADSLSRRERMIAAICRPPVLARTTVYRRSNNGLVS
jgi:hypothetical protein